MVESRAARSTERIRPLKTTRMRSWVMRGEAGVAGMSIQVRSPPPFQQLPYQTADTFRFRTGQEATRFPVAYAGRSRYNAGGRSGAQFGDPTVEPDSSSFPARPRSRDRLSAARTRRGDHSR